MNSNKPFEAKSDQASHIIILQQKKIYIFLGGGGFLIPLTVSWLSVSKGVGSRTPVDTKIYRWPSPLCKMAQYLHKTYTHPPIYFKSSLKVKVKLLSCMGLFATSWTVTHQAPLSMGLFRQEYWSGLPFLSPGDLPNPGIEPGSPALQADALTSKLLT